MADVCEQLGGEIDSSTGTCDLLGAEGFCRILGGTYNSSTGVCCTKACQHMHNEVPPHSHEVATPNVPDPNPNPNPNRDPEDPSICHWSTGHPMGGGCAKWISGIYASPGERATHEIGNRAYMFDEPTGPYKAGTVTVYCDPNPDNSLRTHVIESFTCNDVPNNRSGTARGDGAAKSYRCQITCRHSDPFNIVNYEAFTGNYTLADCESACNAVSSSFCDTKAQNNDNMSEQARSCLEN